MKKTIITISRQSGSGGKVIGKKIAEKLGFSFYDKELLAVEAKNSGLSVDFLKNYDETYTKSFLFSLVMGQQNLFFGGKENMSLGQMADKAQSDAIKEVASKQNCLIVGRAADYILREEEGLFRIFLHGRRIDRIKKIAQRENLSDSEAESRMEQIDKWRRSYYNYHSNQKWGKADNYDVSINSLLYGEEATVDILVDSIKRFQRLKGIN